jgi:MerR family transcriptional regulator/heat shock protein HspR
MLDSSKPPKNYQLSTIDYQIVAMRYLKVSEVLAQLHIGTDFLQALSADDLIHLKESSEGEPVISSEDVERVRMALLLTAELDVNLPGVEVIMHMRDSIVAMQRQFSEILDALVEELRHRLPP